ncbi:MAG: hypothetical protein H0V19_02935, partial [Euzebyales bacterium]|nr:hypothetical protein [Euzebyales bacterium]
MADAGVFTPYHLAASLIALFAAAGLAVVVAVRPGTSPRLRLRDRPGDGLLALGGMLFATGHGLAGAFVAGSETLVAWLHTTGLVLLGVGLSPRRLRVMTGPSAVLPWTVLPWATPPPVTLVALAAGVFAAVRACLGGRRMLLLGAGLLSWGFAEPLEQLSTAAGAAFTVAGALAVGAWLWQACARSLLAKLATASVAMLLTVVVVTAVTLSGLARRDLVNTELRRLEELSS